MSSYYENRSDFASLYLKTRQLLLCGLSNTQKTLLFRLLSPVLERFYASSRVDDYSGAHDFYDIWLYDLTLDSTVVNGVRMLYEMGLDGTFLRILDGQVCRLPAKDSPRMITKRSNVPVVVITSDPPSFLFQGGPSQERFMPMRFVSELPIFYTYNSSLCVLHVVLSQLLVPIFNFPKTKPALILRAASFRPADEMRFVVPTRRTS
ncbi:hypothetical protein SLA2020_264870 [Shorea laevis]|jgi:hypothetical protein